MLKLHTSCSVETNLMSTGATSKLKIKGARSEDSGNYTCTMMGMKATTSVELNIQPGTRAQHSARYQSSTVSQVSELNSQPGTRAQQTARYQSSTFSQVPELK